MATVARGPLWPCRSIAWTCSRYSLLGVSGCAVVLISPERRSTSKRSSPPAAYSQKEWFKFETGASGFWFTALFTDSILVRNTKLLSDRLSGSAYLNVMDTHTHDRRMVSFVEGRDPSSCFLRQKAKEDLKLNLVVHQEPRKEERQKPWRLYTLKWHYIGSNPTTDTPPKTALTEKIVL